MRRRLRFSQFFFFSYDHLTAKDVCFFRYFQAANPSSIGRNIFSVPLPLDGHLKFTDAAPTAEPAPLTDSSSLGKYSAEFSPGAGFYFLSYDGPNVPWQRVIKTDDPSAWHERDELSGCAFLLTDLPLRF